MPTQRDILEGRLQDAISKKAEKRVKNPPGTPKLKPGSGKENRAPKSVKLDTARKKSAKKGKEGKKAPSVL
jgi:hypothetical protein